MLHIRYSDFAVSQIKNFIHLYEEAFFILYKDSGLWAEETIIENYRKTAIELNNRIFSEIEKHLIDDIVLGRKKCEEFLELSFYVGDRLIVVYYSEDVEYDTRLVESVGIDRKPIIF